jgi:hypothetical protein
MDDIAQYENEQTPVHRFFSNQVKVLDRLYADPEKESA